MTNSGINAGVSHAPFTTYSFFPPHPIYVKQIQLSLDCRKNKPLHQPATIIIKPIIIRMGK